MIHITWSVSGEISGCGGSHGWWLRGRWWQMDIHPPCLCPLEELPRGKMHWRAGSRSEAIVKGKLSGHFLLWEEMHTNVLPDLPLWLSPHTRAHTHTHTHQTQAGNWTFFLLSSSFYIFSFCLAVESDSQSFEQQFKLTSPLRAQTAHSSLCTWQFVCHAWQECARMIRASHFCGLQVQGSKKQNHDRYEPWSVVSCSSHHIEEVLQLAFSAISTLARWRLMSFTNNTEWDCGGR